MLIDKEAMANAGPKEALSLPGSLMAKLDEASHAGGRALAEQRQSVESVVAQQEQRPC